MEIERPELRGHGGASSSSVARYLSDAGLSRTRSYTGCEDAELEIRRQHLREIADRIELAHSRMLNEHDRRALAIAERAPYARFIPFYPELPYENGQINHTAQLAPCTSSPQRGAPMYHEVPGEREKVQADLNPGFRLGPWVPSLLGREVAVPHTVSRFFPEIRNGSGSLCQSVEPVEVVRATGLVQDVRIDNIHDPILQNQFTGCNVMFPPQVMHEPPPSLVVPVLVPVPIIEKKIESSIDKNKKRKKEYGNEVIQVKPTMQWSQWPCVWCSVNFDSKEAMDAHLQEQHQSCKGDCPSESEKVEKNRSEARTGLAVTSDDNQMEIPEVSEPHVNTKIHLDLSPSNIKQKHDKINKDEVVPVLENKENIGFNTTKKMKLVVPPLNLKRKSDKPQKEEVVPIPENKEMAGSHTNKKIKLDLPPSNLIKKTDEVTGEEFVQSPHNKEIAGSDINRKMKLVFPSSNSKQKSDEPSREKAVPTPESKEIAGSSNNKKIKLDFPTLNLEMKSVNALRNGSQKSNSANRMVTEKPVQEASQAAPVPKLEGPKETCKDPSKEEVVPTPENKEIGGFSNNTGGTANLRKSDEPSKEEVVPTPENTEIADYSNNKTFKVDVPTLNLEKKSVKALRNESQKSNSANRVVTEKLVQGASQAASVPKLEGPQETRKDPSKEEVVQTPENKEIAGFSNNTRGSANLRKSDEPNKEEVVPSPENKEIGGSSNNKKFKLDLPTMNLEKKSVKALRNGSQKSNSANRMVTEKPVQGASQASSVPKLEGPKETCKDPNKEEVVQTPENKEIAGFSNNTRGSANLRKSDEPSKEEVVPTPENKEIAGSSNNRKTKLDLPSLNLEKKSVKALRNGSQKSNSADRMVTEKFVQGASQAASVPKLEDPKAEPSKSVTSPKPVQGSSAPVPKSEDPKQEISKPVTMPKPVQGASQAASLPKLVKPKEETSKSIPMPQANKLKEVISQDNENRSLKSRTVILSGHRKTAQTTAEFSEKKNYVSVNGTTMPMLVMKDGRWFCNLCQAKWMTERSKEEHINGKRHWLNLQDQPVSCRSEPAEPVMVKTDGTAKPVLVMTDGYWFCNLCQTKQMPENVKEQHINSRRHKQNLEAQAVSYRPEPAKPPTRLHWCFICDIVCTSEDNLIAHYNGKQHREVLMTHYRGI